MPENHNAPADEASQEAPTTTEDDEQNTEEMLTPRASEHRQSFPSPGSSEVLNMNHNYFPPPPPSGPALETTPSHLIAPQAGLRPVLSKKPSSTGLQAKPTTAISLPEGVYAQQQDGVSSGDGTGSITTALSYSDTMSIKSLAPTINAGDNDIAGMLGEILEDTETSFGSAVPSDTTEVEDLEDEEDVSEGEEELPEEEQLARWRSKKKHFFILSSAGKPIYSRHGTESIITSYFGVIQTIISFFADSSDSLQTFEFGTHRFVVLEAGPLYLVAISAVGETAAQLRAQLEALYSQVISTLSLPQLNRAFAQRSNFDLRRLLGGTDVFLNGLVDSMTRGSPQVLLSALECVKLRKTYREKLNDILLKTRAPSLLYGLIIADHRLVSVIRPKRHSLHPPDLQLLFSMLFNASTFRDGGEHWTPICLPKFNSKGFLHAYIHFFHPPDACMVLVSADKDAFFEMRTMREAVERHLEASDVLPHIVSAVERYAPTDAAPGFPIGHFLYKSRQNVQYTMPSFGAHYSAPAQRRRIMGLYHRLHASVHTRAAHLKICYVSGRYEEALSWVSPTFEIYVVAKPETKREVMVKGAQKIVAWVEAEQERLFVIGGATF